MQADDAKGKVEEEGRTRVVADAAAEKKTMKGRQNAADDGRDGRAHISPSPLLHSDDDAQILLQFLLLLLR